MNWRSFGAGFAAACVLLGVLWMATGGRYMVVTHSRISIKTDRLTGKTHLLVRDQWREITTP